MQLSAMQVKYLRRDSPLNIGEPGTITIGVFSLTGEEIRNRMYIHISDLGSVAVSH